MSQMMVASRPVTSSSNMPKLPHIEHPLSRMQTAFSGLHGTAAVVANDGLEMRGFSRASHHGAVTDRIASSRQGRPLPSEELPTTTKSLSGRSHIGRTDRSSLYKSAPVPITSYEVIPEGVEVVHADPSKTSLPVFGIHADVSECALERNRSAVSRVEASQSAHSNRLDSLVKARLEVDEIDTLIRDKIKGSYYEVRKRFIDNDPEEKGNVSRDALLRILVSLIGRPISQAQLSSIFKRHGLRSDKSVISFTEIFTTFREFESEEYPLWMDTVQRHQHDKAFMSCEQVHSQLREKIRQRFINLADIFPQVIEGGSGRLLKLELRNALNKMLYFMDDSEFEKLWSKYDPHNTGAVNGVQMLRQMGIVMRQQDKKAKHNSETEKGETHQRTSKSEIDRNRSLDIECWLKEKFREGFQNMRLAFEEKDVSLTGYVPYEDFLQILKKFGLNLEKTYLNEFLARCAVTMSRTGGVPYRDFLHRFQDRSEAGMAHKILSDPHHLYNTQTNDVVKDAKVKVGAAECFGSLESQLMNMFQRDFLTLLTTFQKLDRHSLGLLSREEFRAVMESKFRFELTDEQFADFVNHLPLNSEGLIKYGEFMKQFDTRGLAPSLWKVEASDNRSDMEDENPHLDEDVIVSNDADQRSVKEIWQVIKNLFEYRFQELEVAFHDVDVYNSGRLTQEQMHQLLEKMNVQPKISHGEIRNLWKNFILRDGQKLDYHEFCRAFMYNPKTSSFPNAKVVPPRKGDSDFMMRSRKLNGDADMLQDNLRSKVDYMWDVLRTEFIAMDPYGTGCVTQQEFEEVLKELNVFLSDFELKSVTQKFTTTDSRVSYIEFLKPFAAKRQAWRHGSNMLTLLQHPNAQTHHKQQSADNLSRLREKFHGDWKNIRRAYKKLDSENTGFISLPELRSVLKLANISLDEEDVYQIMTKYDESMTGRIPYNRFLKDAFQAELHGTSKKTKPLKK